MYVARFNHYFSSYQPYIWKVATNKDDLVKQLTFCQLQRAVFMEVDANDKNEAIKKAEKQIKYVKALQRGIRGIILD